MNALSLDDLFTAGLGFDIAGGALLAKGLVISPAQHLRRSGSYYGRNEPLIIGMAEDWRDGTAGLISLLLGFVLQASGYIGIVAGVKVSAGGTRAVVALAFAFLAIAVVSLVWLTLRRPILMQRLVSVAREQSPAGKPPDGELLVALGRRLGREAEPGENQHAYCCRVFGVRDVWAMDMKTFAREMMSGSQISGR